MKEVKRIDAAMGWLILDMRPYGIPRPESGFGTELLLNWRVPVSDMGTADHIKKGDIRIITGRVERFTKQGVCFSDKTEQAFDAVVPATGFRHGLEEFPDDHASLLGPRPPAPPDYRPGPAPRGPHRLPVRESLSVWGRATDRPELLSRVARAHLEKEELRRICPGREPARERAGLLSHPAGH